MKRSSVFNIFLIALLIIGCSSNENTSAYCPEDGCLLERNNPNERFSETAECGTQQSINEEGSTLPEPIRGFRILLVNISGSNVDNKAIAVDKTRHGLDDSTGRS